MPGTQRGGKAWLPAFLYLPAGRSGTARMPGATRPPLATGQGAGPPPELVPRGGSLPAALALALAGDRYAFSFSSRNSFPASFHRALLLRMEIHQVPEATDDFSHYGPSPFFTNLISGAIKGGPKKRRLPSR